MYYFVGTLTQLSGVGDAVHPRRVQTAVTVQRALVPVLVAAAAERVQGGQRGRIVRAAGVTAADGQRADRGQTGLARVAGRRDGRVQRAHLPGAPLAGRHEHDDGDQHRAANGRARRDRDPVHVAGHRSRRPDLPALAVRHRVRRDVDLLQRYHAHDHVLLRSNAQESKTVIITYVL